MSHLGKIVGASSLAGGAAGVIVGGAMSAAKQYQEVKEQKITKEEAVKKVAKEAAGTGISTAVGAVAATVLRTSGLFSILVFVAAAAGTKYLLDTQSGNACKAVKKAASKTAKAVSEKAGELSSKLEEKEA